MCAVLMGALGLYVLLSGAVSWWRALLAILLLMCPVTTIWISWNDGRRDRMFEDHDTKEIRHGS